MYSYRLIKTNDFHFVRFLFNGVLIFCSFWVILRLFWPYRAIFGIGVGSEKFFGVYRLITFIFFCLLTLIFFCFFWVILSLFGPSRAIFWVGVGSKKFFGVYSCRLAIFVL